MTDQLIECRMEFELRAIPRLNLKRNADGSYRYQAAKLAFRDFLDGWRAAKECSGND